MGLYCFQNFSISYLLQCNSQLEEECLNGLVLLSEHLYILPVAVKQPIRGRIFVCAYIALRTSLYLTCCSVTAN